MQICLCFILTTNKNDTAMFVRHNAASRVLSRNFSLGGEARHFNQRTSYVTNMQLLSIKHHKRRIDTLFRLKLCMTFTVKFYDVLLLCSDSNVLPLRESEPSMQM